MIQMLMLLYLAYLPFDEEIVGHPDVIIHIEATIMKIKKGEK